jgi:ribosomal protein L37AE/L43A
MSYWLLLEKSDETRVSKGIDGYRDTTGKYYYYDSLVPNFRNVSIGDSIVIRKENEILGIGRIGSISESDHVKTHRRCPYCNSTDIRDRKNQKLKWKCGKCTETFSNPNETSKSVRKYSASIDDFIRLDDPPSVREVKMCAHTPKGDLSQLSMLRLDPIRIRTLLEGRVTTPPHPLQPQTVRGQGFGLSHAERRAVELRAMQLARELFEREGYEVDDRSASHPYDLLATRNAENRFIEVKGTTGEGRSVILTHGEVSHIRSNSDNSVIVIVSGINLIEKDGEWVGTEGVYHRIDPWNMNDADLTPTQYRYEIRK